MRSLKKKSLDKVANIITRNNKNDFSIRNLIDDLDILPFPDYSLLACSSGRSPRIDE